MRTETDSMIFGLALWSLFGLDTLTFHSLYWSKLPRTPLQLSLNLKFKLRTAHAEYLSLMIAKCVKFELQLLSAFAFIIPVLFCGFCLQNAQ